MKPNEPTVAWISDFPVEWLPDTPEAVRRLPRGHPSTWQRVLLNELEKNPAEKLHVVVLRKQLAENFSFTRNGTTFHLLKTIGGLRAPSFFLHDTLLIKRKLAEIKPSVVHAWGTERGAALVAARLGFPYVVTVQGLLTWYNEVVPLAAYQRFAALLEKWSLPRAPLVTTESTFAVQYINHRWPDANVRQVEHAPDWIFHQVARAPQIKPLRFIFVGVVTYIKGVDILLAALDALRGEMDFELVICGGSDPKFLEKLQRQTPDELWRRIQFKKDLRPEEIAAELARATMMIFPTRADTSPNAVKEAVVAGVPVVASAVGGITDYVFPGRNGFLFPAGDVEKCVFAIRAACAHPRFARGEVEPAALVQVRDYLSPRRMGESFREIYQSLATGMK